MHEGHRERLREKILTSPSSLQPHEILEALLFYAIPRKNTNEIAHDLLNRFNGNLRAVFEADMEILKSIKGVGENTACFLKVVSKMMDLISIESPISEKIFCPIDTLKIVKPLFSTAVKELFVILYLGEDNSVLGRSVLSSNNRDYVNLDLQEINRLILIHKPKSVVVAHNHLSGCIQPSKEDDVVTKRIALLLRVAGVNFFDHVIFAQDEFYSYHIQGDLAKINKEIGVLLDSEE